MSVESGRSGSSLEVRSATKRFGATVALDSASLDVKRGEVHALLGHNGSGKSTLVKMISGFLHPDSGTVRVRAGSTHEPPRLGVVHQDLALCGDATVLENCCMSGYRRRRGGVIDWVAERQAITPLLTSLAATFDCDAMVRDLSPADQAVVAIARALKSNQGPQGLDLLVLDEATASLRGQDADKVLSTARLVAAQGGGVLLVTHHMAEVLQAADRATVLSNGRVVNTVEAGSVTEDDLLEMVSGRRLPPQRHAPVLAPKHEGTAVLVARGVSGTWVDLIDLDARAGEVLGLTGAAGAGHEELPYLLSGAVRRARGEVYLDGKRLRGRDLAESRDRGLGLVPGERLKRGLLTVATVRENLSPITRRQHRWRGLSRTASERQWAGEICDKFAVVAPNAESPVAALSGGNQQKVLLARVLEDRPTVLILHEPTQGVDEATRRDLVAHVRRAAKDGAAVLYVSSDIEEVAGCSDRVLVFRKGSVVAEVVGGLAHIDDMYAAGYATGLTELGGPDTGDNREGEV
jgi:ribose transport system ATP-binding protein